MNFDNNGIKIYDVSFYQSIMFEYIDGKRIELPFNKQKHVDFEKMKKKADAVIIKCGQRNYSDPAFNINWEMAGKSGIPRGSYWFCDKNETPKKQAQLYYSLIKHDIGEGFHAADFEALSSPNGSWLDLNSLYIFINEFQQLSGLPDEKIAVYTGYYDFADAIKNANIDWFSKFPLWLAWYINNPDYVKIPGTWKEVTLWQYGTPVEGYDAGVHSLEIDSSFFNGNAEKFKKFFQKKELPDENKEYVLTKSNFEIQYENRTILLEENK